MKLPSRPAASPSGTSGATKSVTSSQRLWRARANSQSATSTPRKPPWKLMPPCQTANISSGCCEVVERLVEQHVAEAAAEDHAEDAVEQHVVDVARVPAGEQVLPRAMLAQHDEQHEADQVHEPVPAHRERADLERDRIELRMDEHGGRGGRAAPALEWRDRLYAAGAPDAAPRRRPPAARGVPHVVQPPLQAHHAGRRPLAQPRDAARGRLRRRRLRQADRRRRQRPQHDESVQRRASSRWSTARWRR